MIPALFVTTVTAEAMATLSVAASIVFPRCRLWPPNEDRAWTAYLVWLVFIISAVGTILIGILDWGSLMLPSWVRWGMGSPLWLGGCALAQWAIHILGVASSFGDSGGLTQRGPYRFSRNPQYLGFILSLLGWALVTSSQMTLEASLSGLVPLVLVPFAEEPWLEAMYGASYDAYKRSVPRFVALPWRRDP